jgi:3-oxoacyl-[acyl-carrier-protein] synthase-3
MKGKFENIKIAGMVTVVPKRIQENSEYEKWLGGKRVRKQAKLIGIERRHRAEEGHSASDLCIEAANSLLSKLNWNRDTVDYLILVTQTPDFEYPSTSFYIHKELGLSKECVVFDVNLGCSGFTSGLQIICSMLQNAGKRGILLTGDVEYRTKEQLQKPEYVESASDDMLFGQAASATAFEKAVSSPICFSQNSDGTRYRAIMHERGGDFTYLDGQEIFNFAMNEVAESVGNFKKYFSIQDEEVDYYVFHQAQKLILDTVADICEIETDKNLFSLKDYGNTSSSSIPLTLCANLNEFKNREKINVFMCGFGIGLSWSNVYMELKSSSIYPVEISKWREKGKCSDA